MLEIRRATAEDADEVRVIVDQMTTFLRQFYRPTDAAYSQRSRTQGQRTRLVAVCEGAVVGTVEHLVDGDVLRIIGLAVHECHRRRGVARALVEQLVTESAELGCHTMSISTVTATGNVPVFEALGFGVVRVCPAEFSISQTGVPLLEAVLERPTPSATASTVASAAPSDQLPVDVGAVAFALQRHVPGAASFLDRQTGNVLLLDDEADEETRLLWAHLEQDASRYAEILPISWFEMYGIVQDFIRQLPEGKAKRKLFGATRRHHGSIRRFRGALEAFPSIREQWSDFHEAVMQDRARKWLESYRADPEGFGVSPSLQLDAPGTDDFSGECRACGLFGFVTGDMLCRPCAEGIERDLIRMRDWEYSALAYGLQADGREALRDRVIKEHGEALEIIAEPAGVGSGRRRKGRRA